MITMSEADLRERLRRTSSSQLRKLFGTDDEAQIKQRIQQMNEIERQQEEERQARLTAEQRLTEQLENERKARIAAEQRMQRIADQRAVESQGAMITRLASQHINPEYTDEASLAFARHIQQQRPQAVARMTEKDIGKWFADYAAKKPALARQGATPPPGPRVETRPAGSPRPPPRPPQGQRPQNPTQKTMRPGQPNSMTREEVRAELRKRGINYG